MPSQPMGSVPNSSCLSFAPLLRTGGGRPQHWELRRTQACAPLVAGRGGPNVASEVSEEAQALLVLRRWQEMPELGIQLVPEHVETRPLYHPRSPGLPQVREGSEPQNSHLHLDLGPSPRPLPGHDPATSDLTPDPGPQHSHSSLRPPSGTPYLHPRLCSFRIPTPGPPRLRAGTPNLTSTTGP